MRKMKKKLLVRETLKNVGSVKGAGGGSDPYCAGGGYDGGIGTGGTDDPNVRYYNGIKYVYVSGRWVVAR